eukprot:TRINITY_DN677_c0_g6_i1.p1 TRINITY_DN677_c0_g6~~TRINITY_DN677_c0_g6_i1.p1  ORF type:complete len:121 (-),score=26.51 TRINITY_DN677_c0_g6_i1:109-471(-)
MANEWKAFEPPSQLPEKTKTDWMEALKKVADVHGVPQALENYDEREDLDEMMTAATAPVMLKSKLRSHWRSLKGIVQSRRAVSPVDPLSMKEMMERLETTLLEQAKLLEHFKRDHYSYSI